MIVYVWSRRNPFTRMQFIGLIDFTAPYLPWVLLFFSLILGHDTTADLLGIFIGHFYYYSKWIYPDISKPNTIRIVQTPQFLNNLFIDPLLLQNPNIDINNNNNANNAQNANNNDANDIDNNWEMIDNAAF